MWDVLQLETLKKNGFSNRQLSDDVENVLVFEDRFVSCNKHHLEEMEDVTHLRWFVPERDADWRQSEFSLIISSADQLDWRWWKVIRDCFQCFLLLSFRSFETNALNPSAFFFFSLKEINRIAMITTRHSSSTNEREYFFLFLFCWTTLSSKVGSKDQQELFGERPRRRRRREMCWSIEKSWEMRFSSPSWMKRLKNKLFLMGSFCLVKSVVSYSPETRRTTRQKNSLASLSTIRTASNMSPEWLMVIGLSNWSRPSNTTHLHFSFLINEKKRQWSRNPMSHMNEAQKQSEGREVSLSSYMCVEKQWVWKWLLFDPTANPSDFHSSLSSSK